MVRGGEGRRWVRGVAHTNAIFQGEAKACLFVTKCQVHNSGGGCCVGRRRGGGGGPEWFPDGAEPSDPTADMMNLEQAI